MSSQTPFSRDHTATKFSRFQLHSQPNTDMQSTYSSNQASHTYNPQSSNRDLQQSAFSNTSSHQNNTARYHDNYSGQQQAQPNMLNRDRSSNYQFLGSIPIPQQIYPQNYQQPQIIPDQPQQQQQRTWTAAEPSQTKLENQHSSSSTSHPGPHPVHHQQNNLHMDENHQMLPHTKKHQRSANQNSSTRSGNGGSNHGSNNHASSSSQHNHHNHNNNNNNMNSVTYNNNNHNNQSAKYSRQSSSGQQHSRQNSNVNKQQSHNNNSRYSHNNSNSASNGPSQSHQPHQHQHQQSQQQPFTNGSKFTSQPPQSSSHHHNKYRGHNTNSNNNNNNNNNNVHTAPSISSPVQPYSNSHQNGANTTTTNNNNNQQQQQQQQHSNAALVSASSAPSPSTTTTTTSSNHMNSPLQGLSVTGLHKLSSLLPHFLLSDQSLKVPLPVIFPDSVIHQTSGDKSTSSHHGNNHHNSNNNNNHNNNSENGGSFSTVTSHSSSFMYPFGSVSISRPIPFHELFPSMSPPSISSSQHRLQLPSPPGSLHALYPIIPPKFARAPDYAPLSHILQNDTSIFRRFRHSLNLVTSDEVIMCVRFVTVLLIRLYRIIEYRYEIYVAAMTRYASQHPNETILLQSDGSFIKSTDPSSIPAQQIDYVAMLQTVRQQQITTAAPGALTDDDKLATFLQCAGSKHFTLASFPNSQQSAPSSSQSSLHSHDHSSHSSHSSMQQQHQQQHQDVSLLEHPILPTAHDEQCFTPFYIPPNASFEDISQFYSTLNAVPCDFQADTFLSLLGCTQLGSLILQQSLALLVCKANGLPFPKIPPQPLQTAASSFCSKSANTTNTATATTGNSTSSTSSAAGSATTQTSNKTASSQTTSASRPISAQTQTQQSQQHPNCIFIVYDMLLTMFDESLSHFQQGFYPCLFRAFASYIFVHALPNTTELCTDTCGNYILQAFIPHWLPQQLHHFSMILAPNLHELSAHGQSTRVIQALLYHVRSLHTLAVCIDGFLKMNGLFVAQFRRYLSFQPSNSKSGSLPVASRATNGHNVSALKSSQSELPESNISGSPDTPLGTPSLPEDDHLQSPTEQLVKSVLDFSVSKLQPHVVLDHTSPFNPPLPPLSMNPFRLSEIFTGGRPFPHILDSSEFYLTQFSNRVYLNQDAAVSHDVWCPHPLGLSFDPQRCLFYPQRPPVSISPIQPNGFLPHLSTNDSATLTSHPLYGVSLRSLYDPSQPCPTVLPDQLLFCQSKGDICPTVLLPTAMPLINDDISTDTRHNTDRRTDGATTKSKSVTSEFSSSTDPSTISAQPYQPSDAQIRATIPTTIYPEIPDIPQYCYCSQLFDHDYFNALQQHRMKERATGSFPTSTSSSSQSSYRAVSTSPWSFPIQYRHVQYSPRQPVTLPSGATLSLEQSLHLAETDHSIFTLSNPISTCWCGQFNQYMCSKWASLIRTELSWHALIPLLLRCPLWMLALSGIFTLFSTHPRLMYSTPNGVNMTKRLLSTLHPKHLSAFYFRAMAPFLSIIAPDLLGNFTVQQLTNRVLGKYDVHLFIDRQLQYQVHETVICEFNTRQQWNSAHCCPPAVAAAKKAMISFFNTESSPTTTSSSSASSTPATTTTSTHGKGKNHQARENAGGNTKDSYIIASNSVIQPFVSRRPYARQAIFENSQLFRLIQSQSKAAISDRQPESLLLRSKSVMLPQITPRNSDFVDVPAVYSHFLRETPPSHPHDATTLSAGFLSHEISSLFQSRSFHIAKKSFLCNYSLTPFTFLVEYDTDHLIRFPYNITEPNSCPGNEDNASQQQSQPERHESSTHISEAFSKVSTWISPADIYGSVSSELTGSHHCIDHSHHFRMTDISHAYHHECPGCAKNIVYASIARALIHAFNGAMINYCFSKPISCIFHHFFAASNTIFSTTVVSLWNYLCTVGISPHVLSEPCGRSVVNRLVDIISNFPPHLLSPLCLQQIELMQALLASALAQQRQSKRSANNSSQPGNYHLNNLAPHIYLTQGTSFALVIDGAVCCFAPAQAPDPIFSISHQDSNVITSSSTSLSDTTTTATTPAIGLHTSWNTAFTSTFQFLPPKQDPITLYETLYQSMVSSCLACVKTVSPLRAASHRFIAIREEVALQLKDRRGAYLLGTVPSNRHSSMNINAPRSLFTTKANSNPSSQSYQYSHTNGINNNMAMNSTHHNNNNNHKSRHSKGQKSLDDRIIDSSRLSSSSQRFVPSSLVLSSAGVTTTSASGTQRPLDNAVRPTPHQHMPLPLQAPFQSSDHRHQLQYHQLQQPQQQQQQQQPKQHHFQQFLPLQVSSHQSQIQQQPVQQRFSSASSGTLLSTNSIPFRPQVSAQSPEPYSNEFNDDTTTTTRVASINDNNNNNISPRDTMFGGVSAHSALLQPPQQHSSAQYHPHPQQQQLQQQHFSHDNENQSRNNQFQPSFDTIVHHPTMNSFPNNFLPSFQLQQPVQTTAFATMQPASQQPTASIQGMLSGECLSLSSAQSSESQPNNSFRQQQHSQQSTDSPVVPVSAHHPAPVVLESFQSSFTTPNLSYSLLPGQPSSRPLMENGANFFAQQYPSQLGIDTGNSNQFAHLQQQPHATIFSQSGNNSLHHSVDTTSQSQSQSQSTVLSHVGSTSTTHSWLPAQQQLQQQHQQQPKQQLVEPSTHDSSCELTISTVPTSMSLTSPLSAYLHPNKADFNEPSNSNPNPNPMTAYHTAMAGRHDVIGGNVFMGNAQTPLTNSFDATTAHSGQASSQLTSDDRHSVQSSTFPASLQAIYPGGVDGGNIAVHFHSPIPAYNSEKAQSSFIPTTTTPDPTSTDHHNGVSSHHSNNYEQDIYSVTQPSSIQSVHFFDQLQYQHINNSQYTLNQPSHHDMQFSNNQNGHDQHQQYNPQLGFSTPYSPMFCFPHNSTTNNGPLQQQPSSFFNTTYFHSQTQDSIDENGQHSHNSFQQQPQRSQQSQQYNHPQQPVSSSFNH